jgi:hypothetical protein
VSLAASRRDSFCTSLDTQGGRDTSGNGGPVLKGEAGPRAGWCGRSSSWHFVFLKVLPAEA